MCFLIATNAPLLSYGRTASSSSSSTFPSRMPRNAQSTSSSSSADRSTSSTRMDYSTEDWWQDTAGTGGGASSDDEDESESESSSDEEDWNRLSALAQATIEEAERQSRQPKNNNYNQNKVPLTEKSSLSTPDNVRKTSNNHQKAGSMASAAASNFQPIKTLNKLQQMLDDSDYITSNRERKTNSHNDGLSKRFLTNHDPMDEAIEDSAPEKLWTSKDRAKYKRQQNRIRERTNAAEAPPSRESNLSEAPQASTSSQQQNQPLPPPIRGTQRSPAQTQLPPQRPYVRPSPPIQFSSDDDNSEEEDLGYTLPNLPVYYSDGEESDVSDDETSATAGSRQAPVQYALPYPSPEHDAQRNHQQQQQTFQPHSVEHGYPHYSQNHHPGPNNISNHGEQPPAPAQGYSYGPPQNPYHSQQQERQQEPQYPPPYMTPQQQQQQQQSYYANPQKQQFPYWNGYPPPPQQQHPEQFHQSHTRPGSLSMPQKPSLQPMHRQSQNGSTMIRPPSSQSTSGGANDSGQVANPDGAHGVPGFQYMQQGYTPVTIFMPPESLDEEKSHTMSFSSFQKVGLVLLTLTLGCYAAVSPQNLPLSEYNLRFYENLGLLSLAAVAPIVYSILVIAPRENDINDFIHTFFTSFTLGYLLSFVSEIMATTVVRLLVFSWFEPKIFSLAPKVPVPVIPWVLRETGYRPKRITLLAAEIAAAVIICPILEEYIKLCVVRWTVSLKKNFSWIKKASAPPSNNNSRTKACWTSEPIVRPPNEPDIVNANQYITQFLAASLGMKYADAGRRILLFTKASDPSKSLYAFCRGLFPLQELTGTMTALGLAQRDLLGVKRPTWKLLLPAIVIHGMANFRGKKPIYRWGSCTPWSEMQLPAFHIPDSSPLPKLLSKGFAKIMWFVIIIRVIGYCAKNYYMINRQAIKRTTTYAGKPAAFSAKLTTSELLKKK